MSRQLKLASWQQLKNYGKQVTEVVSEPPKPEPKIVHELPKVEVLPDPESEPTPELKKINKKLKPTDGD